MQIWNLKSESKKTEKLRDRYKHLSFVLLLSNRPNEHDQTKSKS